MVKVTQNHFGVNSGTYLSNMVGWGKGDFLFLIKHIVKSILGYLSGNSYYGLLFVLLTPISFIVCAVILSLKLRGKSWLPLIYAFLMVLSPYIFIIILGGVQPPRTMISLSVVEAAIVTYALSLIGSQIITLIISITVAIYGCLAASQLFYSDYMSYQSDMLLANRIVTMINVKVPNFDAEKNKVYFYGAHVDQNEWRKNNSDVFGNSFFSWDGGNNSRIISFMRRTGVAYLNKVDSESVSDLRKTADSMPTWPNSDSVKKIDNVVVIKLGTKPGVD